MRRYPAVQAAAEAGALAIMVGGAETALERARPILSCYAKTIVHIGPNGAGQVAKACNQICTIVNQLGAAEAMLLAERAGVDPAKVKDALMGGFAASRMLDLQAPKMIARNFDGQVESRLHHKDIRIVLDLARTLDIELPASRVAADILTSASGAGRRETGFGRDLQRAQRRATLTLQAPGASAESPCRGPPTCYDWNLLIGDHVGQDLQRDEPWRDSSASFGDLPFGRTYQLLCA